MRGKGRDQSRVDIRGFDVLESPRNGAQNPDRIFAFGVGPVATVKPRRKGNDDHDGGIPQNRDEEEDTGWMGI